MDTSWNLPSVPRRVEILHAALEKSGRTAAQFCTRYLQNDTQSKTKVLPHTGELKFDAATDVLIASGVTPMFGDLVYPVVKTTTDSKVTEEKGDLVGFVTSVRKITASNYYAISIKDDSQNPQTPPDGKYYFEHFALDLAPQCMNVGSADVIATFVAQDKDGKRYRDLVNYVVQDDENGTITWEQHVDPPGSGNLVDWDKASVEQETNQIEILAGVFTSELGLVCDGDMVDGKCQARLEKAVLHVGQIPDFRSYLKATTDFQMDFAEAVGLDNAWVPEFSAFFVVDELSYSDLVKRDKQLRQKLLTSKDQCTAQFLLKMHHMVFETYLMQLNNLWQQPNMTTSKTVAVMWLLYYTQLPVFVFKLLEMMTPRSSARSNIVSRIHVTVKAFHDELLSHLTGFLPVRDKTNSTQRQIVDDVRACLEQIRVGVQEQMSQAVVRQTPECLET